MKAGEHVILNGAPRSVGSAAVQLAKYLGAHVFEVGSVVNASLVRRLGADEVLDYAATDFVSGGAGYDVVLDAVGSAPYARVKFVLSTPAQP